MKGVVRTNWAAAQPDGRAVSATFLDHGVLVLADDGDMRVLTQAGMIDVWEELWRDTEAGPVGGWVRA